MGRLAFALVFWLALTLSVVADQTWRPVVVDAFKTAWFVNMSTARQTDEGTQVWIKKVFDPATSAELFQKYNVRPSAYDIELWLLRPERTVSILQVVRYNAKSQTIETYDFESKGKAPTRAVPPDSTIEVIWKLFMVQSEVRESQQP